MWDRTSCGTTPSGMPMLEPFYLGWEGNTWGTDVELFLPHLCQSVLCLIKKWTQFWKAVIYFRTTLSADQSFSELHMLQVFPLALEQSSDKALDEGQVCCGWKHSVLSQSARKRNCHQRAHEKSVISTPWLDIGPWAKSLSLPWKKEYLPLSHSSSSSSSMGHKAHGWVGWP